MYYKTDKNQYYKVNKGKSVKVSEEEYENNKNRLDKFNTKDLRTIARGYNREVTIKNISKSPKKRLIEEIVKATKRYPSFHQRVNGDVFKLIEYFENKELKERRKSPVVVKKVSSKRKSPVVVKKVSSKRTKPIKGDIVKIIIKPYDKKVTINGVVKDVLTKKEEHSKGHKVRLQDGTVGRVIKILKAKK